MAASLSKTSDSLASTELLSSSSPRCSAVEIEDDTSSTTTSSAIDQFPVLPPDPSQVAGMWAGQGASLGDFYTIEYAPRSGWRCCRSGLRGPKTLKLCWQPATNCMVLGGRYALDPESLVQNSQSLIWNRIPQHGEGPKQVVWKRHHPKEEVPKKAKTESVTTELAVGPPEPLTQSTNACLEEQTYSRSVMLLVFERNAKEKDDGQASSTAGISTASLSKVQFRCPPSMQGMRHTPCTQGDQSEKKKIRQAVRKPRTQQRNEDVRCEAPAVIDWHVKQQDQEEGMEEDTSASMSDGQLAEPVSTNQKTSLDWDPCGSCPQSTGNMPETVEILARLLFRSQAPPEDASSLRVSAPEFVPSDAGAKQLRSEAPEFLPSAAYELSEAVALAFEAVGRKPQNV